MQAETVKRSGFPHERVRKQEVQTKKTLSCWWKRAPHQPITKLHGKPRDLVAGGVWKGQGGKVKAAVPVTEAASEIASFKSWEICDI